MNNGICVAPHQCNCPEDFTGPQCQFENKPCLNFPAPILNAHKKCNSQYDLKNVELYCTWNIHIKYLIVPIFFLLDHVPYPVWRILRSRMAPQSLILCARMEIGSPPGKTGSPYLTVNVCFQSSIFNSNIRFIIIYIKIVYYSCVWSTLSEWWQLSPIQFLPMSSSIQRTPMSIL